MSVFAPEGSDLGDAKKISSKDIVVYNEGARSGGIGKATIVEGLIAECVVSCKQSLDVVYYNQTDMSIEDALISSFKLIGMELMSLIDMLPGRS